jgi:hypothetical protein
MRRQQTSFKDAARLILLILLINFFHVQQSSAQQYIGVGTNNPLTRLHVYDGPSGNTSPFPPLTVESNMNAYITLLTPNTNESGLFFGKASYAAHGGIIYNNTSNPDGLQFRTNGNLNRMVITNTGDIGIGTLTPGAGFVVRRGSSAGGTAEFWGTTNITHINFSSGEDTYIRGGKTNSNVIINDIPGGKVGIRTYPSAQFDILGGNNWDLTGGEGDMRIGDGTHRLKFGIALAGGGAGGAGIMQFGHTGGFNNLALGSQGKNYININGSSDYVDLTNLNGGLRINGNAGAGGQMLQSGGASAAPSWSSVSSWLFNNLQMMQQSGTTTIAWPNTGSFGSMNYGDFSLVVTTTSKLLLYSVGNMESLSCFACGPSAGFIQTQINKDGTAFSVFFAQGNADNGHVSTLNGMILYQIPPGTYTFFTYGANQGGPDVKFSNARLLIVLIPQ